MDSPSVDIVHCEILEYYDNAAGAIMELNWMRPGKNAFDVIPQTKFYSA